jgi:nifR3 family TIM-barrel protein
MINRNTYSNSNFDSEKPDFMIGDVPVFGRVMLAPMDGYSDSPYRQLTRRFGSAISYSEFINTMEVIHHHRFLYEMVNYVEDERPFVFQVFDNDPQRIYESVMILKERQPDIIDINMGCSAKNVSGRGAGAGLMRDPKKVEEIFSTLSAKLNVPVTGKIRLGWDDDSLNYMLISQIIEENGGKAVAVHGRTRQMQYRGEARWEPIAEIKAARKIPVIGNGDVKTPDDIERMLNETGVDGVMIGRAATGNPWIFQRRNKVDVPKDEMVATIKEHLRLMVKHYGEERGVTVFRKHATRYLSEYEILREERKALLTASDELDFVKVLDQIMSNK